MNIENKLYALKDCVKKFCKEDAEANYYLHKEIDDYLKEKGGVPIFTTEYVTKMADALCDKIINSDLSMDDKDFIMTTLAFLFSINENLDNTEKVYTPTGGTTITSKTEII